MASSHSIKIASLNVQNLTKKTTQDPIDKLAKIIALNKFDIIALQEVASEGVMLSDSGQDGKSAKGQILAYEHSLLSRLGDNWGVIWGDPKTKSQYYAYSGDSRGEGYAFIWNKKRFHLPNNDKGKEIRPRIWRMYSSKFSEGKIRLVRDPFYGRFILNNTKLEIRLITVHINFTAKPKAEKMKKGLNYDPFTLRNAEFHIIAGQIYKRVNEYRISPECTSVYTIILGDYNMNLKSSGLAKPYVPEVACFDEQGCYIGEDGNTPYKIHTAQRSKTTIKEDGSGCCNNFDHFSYNHSYDKKPLQLVKSVTVAPIVKSQNITDKDLEEYRSVLSDHLPIQIVLGF